MRSGQRTGAAGRGARAWLGLLVLLGTSPALAIAEVDLADFGAPISEANLETDDASSTNPGDGSPFTSWTENGVVVTPAAGHAGGFATGNDSKVGLLFAIPPGGFGDGTAVLAFDEPQRSLAIEVGFLQDFVRVALFEDAAGTQAIDTIILGDPEFEVPSLPIFAVRSPVLFRRAEIQDVDMMGMLLNSNMISDLRFTSVPEPSRPLLLALAAAGATLFRRRR